MQFTATLKTPQNSVYLSRTQHTYSFTPFENTERRAWQLNLKPRVQSYVYNAFRPFFGVKVSFVR